MNAKRNVDISHISKLSLSKLGECLLDVWPNSCTVCREIQLQFNNIVADVVDTNLTKINDTTT